jgi:type II secretory pathway pseudopilin PulG
MVSMAGRERGFTYLGLIVTLAIIGLVGAAALKVDALLRRAAAEQELLEIGAAFSDALRSYADATPRGRPQLPPPSLQDLLKDPRYPGVRRHLRKIFVDPMTGKAEWGIVYANNPNGAGGAAGSGGNGWGAGTGAGGSGVLAVYSLSQARPLKVANFDARFQNFENKEHIADWKFAASGQAVSQGPLLAGQAASVQPAPGQSAPPSLFAQRPGQGAAQPTPPGQPGAADPPSLFRDTPAPAPPPDAPVTNSGQDDQDGPRDQPPPATASDSR